MNPNWHEADQLAIYKRSRVVEPKTTWNKSKAGLELGISRFQVQHPNHWATLPPYRYNISNGWSSADVIHTVAKQIISGHG